MPSSRGGNLYLSLQQSPKNYTGEGLTAPEQSREFTTDINADNREKIHNEHSSDNSKRASKEAKNFVGPALPSVTHQVSSSYGDGIADPNISHGDSDNRPTNSRDGQVSRSPIEKLGSANDSQINSVAANVGKESFANKKDASLVLDYNPFANVGKLIQMPSLPTLAKPQKLFNISQLEWKKSATGKPPFPKSFYWQASGSRIEKIGKRTKKVVTGWTLLRNGKCLECGDRCRPPVAYLSAKAWTTLQGERHERQCSEIRILLAKSRGRLNNLRCPECLSRDDGKMSIIGKSS